MFLQVSVCSQGGGGRRTPIWSDNPLADTPHPEMTTAADGTHPTGLHSCFLFLVLTN